jgi:hypothetical protein
MSTPKGRMKNQPKRSLGIFTNFPSIVHGWAEAFHNNQQHEVQKATIRALQELNNHREPYRINVSSESRTYKGILGFEVGVGEGVFFTYLDDETVQRLYNSSSSRIHYHHLDFLIIVTYHYYKHNKTIALNFDHFQLRLIFNKQKIEAQLFHNKGTRRVSLDEILNRIFDEISKRLLKSALDGLTIRNMKTI